jgi:translation initiation factor eIF-2B subunit gamma
MILNLLLLLWKQLLSNVTYSLPTDPKNRSLIDQKAQISADTIIGDSTQISERATIKKSVVGRHCVIGRMAKVVGCVLLDHCVVEEGQV